MRNNRENLGIVVVVVRLALVIISRSVFGLHLPSLSRAPV